MTRRKSTKASRDLTEGLRVRRKLNGPRFGTTSPVLPELSPELETIVNEVMFGRIWARDQLDLRTRSVAVISALTARQLMPQLKTYVANGLNVGLSREEIVEVLLQLVFYVGLPSVTNALSVAKEVFDEDDAAKK